MEAKRLDVGTLLNARMPFMVPKYQRAYAWGQEEIEDFTDDLRRRWKDRDISGQGKSHFLGGIVSIQLTDANNVIGRRYEVIDGQQRLATCELLLWSLEEHYLRLADEASAQGDTDSAALAASRANRIRKDYIEYDDEEDGKPVKRLRIVLSRADKEFFEGLINRIGPVPCRASHDRLANARNKTNTFVQGIVNSKITFKDKLAAVHNLQLSITEDCYIVHLTTEQRAEAYQLFQVLNDRGMSLSDGDLLRSSTLEMLEAVTSIQRETEQLWDEILAGEPSQIDGFLRAFYASRMGKRAGQRSLFDDFYREFFPIASSPEHVRNIVRAMRSELLNFQKLCDGIWPYDESTVPAWDRDRLSLLINVLKHKLCIPFLLAACQLPENEFSELVQLIERAVFRYVMIARRHPTKLSEKYLQAAVAVRKDPSSYTSARTREDLNSLLKEVDEKSFVTLLKEQMKYKLNNSNGTLKYFLTTIEQFSAWYVGGAEGRPQCREKGIIFDVSNLQIEHVYPQSAATTDVQLEEQKHNLGNLSFWGPADNLEASNLAFLEKKPSYQASNISLNRDLGKLKQWTREEITARSDELVRRALRIFQI